MLQNVNVNGCGGFVLEYLSLRNFESHVKTLLRFHKGVNVIVGESDAGKSSIMKALKLLIYNKPKGSEFITYGKKSCIVKAKVDGKIVKRTKGKSNLYYIDKEKYQAFGQSVPDDVSKLFNLSEVNIHQQLDSPFLLQKTSGEVSRYFNSIVDLDVIDRSQINIQNVIKEDERELARTRGDVKKLKESLKEYHWVTDAEDDLRKLELLQRSISKVEKQTDDISYLLTEISNVRRKKKKLTKLLRSKNDVDRLVKLHKEIEEQEETYLEILKIIKKVENVENSIRIKTKQKKKLERTLKRLMPSICPLCKQAIKK